MNIYFYIAKYKYNKIGSSPEEYKVIAITEIMKGFRYGFVYLRIVMFFASEHSLDSM